ncbi:MAG: hypothetical protein UY99_C0005G0041 [Parcubacteria group bacterium GW2011_GWA1_59_11]|nr:MAG: hypothetical protein UY99_C0005G0041 [Parcubacteria group bacterium GW2011_GWA1_59_11]
MAELIWELLSFRYASSWSGFEWLLAGCLWISIAFCFFQACVWMADLLNRLEWAERQARWERTPRAYYEEHRGFYAVFLPQDMHFGGERYMGYLTVVKPMLTFAPDSEWRPERYTGRIPDMVKLFQGWRLEKVDVQGAYFLVPGAARGEDMGEQLRLSPLVSQKEAREILRAEEERCAKTRLTASWFFWHG